MLVRKNNTSYNKNIYVYIITLIINTDIGLKISVLLNIINKHNTLHHCTSSTLTPNNKISIKISIISIVLSLLFYCYLSIVKP